MEGARKSIFQAVLRRSGVWHNGAKARCIATSVEPPHDPRSSADQWTPTVSFVAVGDHHRGSLSRRNTTYQFTSVPRAPALLTTDSGRSVLPVVRARRRSNVGKEARNLRFQIARTLGKTRCAGGYLGDCPYALGGNFLD